jgi:hypothetical protein
VVAGSAISSVLTSTVTLGSAAHKSPLTISNAGGVAPTVAGAIGVASAIAGNVLTNSGAINGGAGSHGATGGAGGVGLDITAAGTFTNHGSISGGAGGAGSSGVGGKGGAGVILNGATLTTSGTISGGQGGSGTTTGVAGDAVQFGTVASTLIVDPGAVFNGQVVANATAADVLELSGTQSGGTPITLGTQFTNFSALTFASGATGTVDATKADLTAHTLTIDGFAIGDTLDITNVSKAGTTQSFNRSSDVLTLTHGTTVITLDFNSSEGGDHFVLTAAGTGTDLTLASDTEATLAAAAQNLTNFVSSDLGLLGDRFLLGASTVGSAPTLVSAVLQGPGAFGLAAQAGIQQSLAHAVTALFKA